MADASTQGAIGHLPTGPSLWLLEGSLTAGAAFEAVLSPEERTRWNGFTDPKRRDQYLTAHGILRHLLAACLALPPDKIELELEPSGRPRLHGKYTSPLHFSLSHTDNLVCWAIHPAGPIGVDAESLAKARAHQAIAQRFFHPLESAYVNGSTNPVEQHRRMLQCWTLKEAWFKAFGGSGAWALPDLNFDFRPETGGVKPLLLAGTAAPTAAQLWSAEPNAEHVVALVWSGGAARSKVHCWRINPSDGSHEAVTLEPRYWSSG